MASIRKRGTSWIADIRRKGHKSISKSFPTKGLAQEWARKVEREMDTKDFKDERGIAHISLADLIDRYTLEFDAIKPFGKNKKATLKMLRECLGDTKLPGMTVDRLTEHVNARMKAGAGGVTIAIDLTYLGGVYKAAKQLWKMPVDAEFITSVRANLEYRGISLKSKERDRRPTDDEISRLCAHYNAKTRQIVPMSELIQFAIATAMRLNEMITIKWSDLNKTDRTIIIRDRKHPKEKIGNDQTVPLLGDAYDIVLRQPKIEGEDRIFPITEGTVSSIFPRACRTLGIVDLRFHDLRHEGISRLFEQGYSVPEVALVSGHRDWKVLARYTQIRAKNLHRSPAPLLAA